MSALRPCGLWRTWSTQDCKNELKTIKNRLTKAATAQKKKECKLCLPCTRGCSNHPLLAPYHRTRHRQLFLLFAMAVPVLSQRLFTRAAWHAADTSFWCNGRISRQQMLLGLIRRSSIVCTLHFSSRTSWFSREGEMSCGVHHPPDRGKLIFLPGADGWWSAFRWRRWKQSWGWTTSWRDFN